MILLDRLLQFGVLKLGLQVKFVGYPKFSCDTPGETLHPGIKSLFDQLRVSDYIISANFLRYGYTHIRLDMLLSNGYAFLVRVKNGLWFGYQVLKADLDSILFDRSRRLCVLFFTLVAQLM